MELKNEMHELLSDVQRRNALAETIQAPRWKCRFCGGGRGHACELPDGHACRWIDTRHTICNNPECLAKYHALVKPALEALIAPRCPGCDRLKSRKMAFCSRCWHALPWALGSVLYEHMDRGFAAYFAEALEFLKTTNSKEITNV